MTVRRLGECSCGAEFQETGAAGEPVEYVQWVAAHLAAGHTISAAIRMAVAVCDCGEEYLMDVDGDEHLLDFVTWVVPHVNAGHTPRVVPS